MFPIAATLALAVAPSPKSQLYVHESGRDGALGSLEVSVASTTKLLPTVLNDVVKDADGA